MSNKMTKEFIKQKTLEIYQSCSIQSFPISVKYILEQLKISCFSYSQLREKNKELYHMSLKLSDDAFTWNHIIFYNENMPYNRIRFSIMHELGHIILKTKEESLANLFASFILAPRIVLHQADFLKETELSMLFGISKQASSIVYSDYIRFYRHKTLSQLSRTDQALRQHFYQKELGFFVFHISQCPECGAVLYNTLNNTCPHCITSITRSTLQEDSLAFYQLEHNWLYPEE